MHHATRSSRRLRAAVAAILATGALLLVGAAPALAWDARTVEGTAAEQRNTTTPRPPGGDQCSLGSPDSLPGLYDFSWACYAHDVCYQNHQIGNTRYTRAQCDAIMLFKMYAECEFRHRWWSPARGVCRNAANAYYAAVRAFGLPSWLSWRPLPDQRPARAAAV